ncbi:bola-like protein [Piromyces finnis]|uniref:Bola-like protein n=1 Tax=Piromyces finnis TaxID=1754191 RepID=A0A1Y1VCF8_9FUNG|nr:bola-like protein [Piromyces finnis]|eukprot:ORX52565.1 bola-like protein [Piromyces finnis]
MNSILSIPCKEKTLKALPFILTHSSYNSIQCLKKVTIPKSTLTTTSRLSTSLYTKQQTNFPFKIQYNYYSTNQDSCNIQNACTTGIESDNKDSTNNKETTSTKKFNNSETPFDIRHEGALTPMEKLLLKKLVNNFEPTAEIKVKDISDGCGSLYMVDVTSTKFDGLRMVKQHRIVMDILEEEMKTWHGIHIVTHPVHTKKRGRNNKKN